MIDRQRLEALLRRRFAGAPLEEIAIAANGVMALEQEGSCTCRKTGKRPIAARRRCTKSAAAPSPAVQS
jgi:hypothetical protein